MKLPIVILCSLSACPFVGIGWASAEAFRVDVSRETMLRQIGRDLASDLIVGDTARIHPTGICEEDGGLYVRSDAELIADDVEETIVLIRRRPGGTFSTRMPGSGWGNLGEDERKAFESAALRRLLLDLTPQDCRANSGAFAGRPSFIEIRTFNGARSLSEATSGSWVIE